MRFVLFKGEKSISDLATRLFRILGRGSEAANKQAADALLKANPQLSDIAKVPVGSPIAIPDTAPPLHPDEQVIAPGLANSFAAERVLSAFESLHQRLSEIETTAAEKVKSGMDRVQTPEMKAGLKTAAGENPNLAERLPNLDSIAKDTKEMLDDLQAAQNSRKQVLTQIQAALASFAKK
jgi:hypothetical protein